MSAPRRSPLPAERVRDADRTRAALLDAARAEFAAKGLAGARVDAIAQRAGVNKQLISYYFGGKDGLYQAILQAWFEQEQEITDPDSTLADTAVRYLRVGQSSADLQRLFIRLSIDQDLTEPLEPADDDLALMRHRQEQGDLAPEIDPGFALLLIQSMVISSVVFPGDALRVTGLDPTSPEFFDKAEEQLRIVIGRLGQRRE